MSMVNAPVLTLLPIEKSVIQRAHLRAAAAGLTLLLNILVSILSLFCLTAIAALYGQSFSPELYGLVVATAIAVNTQDFFRRLSFAEDRRGTALASDCVTYLGRLVMLAVCIHKDATLAQCFIALLIPTLLGIAFHPGLLVYRSFSFIKNSVLSKSNLFWTSGRWLFLQNCVYWCSNQLVIYLIAICGDP